MDLRNRIVALKQVRASDLRGHASNWRRHPEAQRGALTAMLDDIGFVGAILARQVDGGLEILDGHLRADIASDAEVPVLITDLNDQEARKLLLTYDPLSAAAEADSRMLDELIGTVELTDHADLRKLVADLDITSRRANKRARLDEHEVEGMALRPHEHYDYIVVLASTTHDWNKLCDCLEITPTKRARKRSIGICRAIRAERLLELLDRPGVKPAAKRKTKRKTKRKARRS